MKIGVSGASGHLGRGVVSELLQRPGGHEVVAITRTPETVPAPAQRRFGDYDRPDSLREAYAGLDRLLIISSADPELKRGHKVRAVTRDPNSSQAKLLANAGASLVTASLEDTVAITKALEGATSLFAMTVPFGGTDAEIRQGIAAADAAKAAGVHLVFTSVGSANRQTGVPHFDSKGEVEKHIAKAGARATILAPVAFMENLYFAKGQLAQGIYAAALPPTRALAQIAVADIGAVAIRVLEDAGRFTGKRYDLAGDELTGNEAMAILSRVTGRPFSYYQVPLDVIRQRMGEDAVKMYEWFDRVGYAVDRAALRREFPDVAFHDFESWAKMQDWKALLKSA
jgi:uncharacterized protein YbjT (DUF2867 family)